MKLNIPKSRDLPNSCMLLGQLKNFTLLLGLHDQMKIWRVDCKIGHLIMFRTL
jgi:hypothetical protein